jgi:RimJ/RimL family protein N-acetyltransferase
MKGVIRVAILSVLAIVLINRYDRLAHKSHVKSIRLDVYEGNIPAIRLYEKCGFKYTHDEFYPPTGLYHPSYLMTKQDYMNKKIEKI